MTPNDAGRGDLEAMRMKIIITGGAGFIGCNAAARFMRQGHSVVILDNLSRRGTHKNLEWLHSQGDFTFHREDVRRSAPLRDIFAQHRDAGAVLHLAAQVAVTTSIADPRTDFEVNALGTLNVLEATRLLLPDAVTLYASTNKVYGALHHLRIEERHGRYQLATRQHGVAEDEPLDFHSPYGCSKGAADQHVLDYSRIYGLRSVCLRQSCIYGERQFGVEDQGWVAWFAIAASFGRPVTIYGDGKQVRDALFVGDLCELYARCIERADSVSARAYNVGGGPSNQLSLLELVHHLERRLGRSLRSVHAEPRPGDQQVFVADVSRAKRELGWEPRTPVLAGVDRLLAWIADNWRLFSESPPLTARPELLASAES